MPAAPILVLAIDGGNSKSEAVVADAGGRVRGYARAGTTDIYAPIGRDGALDALEALAREALARAGATAGDLAAVVGSLAGADWPEDIELLHTALAARLDLATAPLIVNDAMGGMRAGSPTWEGIAVVCGTFNAVGARNADGRIFHLGFWPDRTGGFDLGQEVLKAVYRDGLGLGPATSLTPTVLQRYGTPDAVELMHLVTRREGGLGLTAGHGLSEVLLHHADAGDEVSGALVDTAGTWLGDEARVSADRVGLTLDGTLVVLTGGVLQHPSTRLADAVMARLPGAVPVRPTAPPVVGALLLAFDLAEQVVDPGLLAEGVDAARTTVGAAATATTGG